MNFTYPFSRLYIIFFLSISANFSYAQIKYQPYSYQFHQKLNKDLYSAKTQFHTASRPTILKDQLLVTADSLQNLNQVGSDNLFLRKIFNEHLIEVNKEDHSFYLDFLPDFQVGKELISSDKRNTWLNTRGFQVGLTIKDRFSFYANAFENQARFPLYIEEYMVRNDQSLGQGNIKSNAKGAMDWMYATASMTYDVDDYLQVTLAYDKNHIGDGYRSLLLSDFSSNYTHLKLSGKIGNVQYTSIWAYMLDPTNPRIDGLDTLGRFGDGIKWGAFQYLDYNVTNRLSVGFFQSVIWANKNQAGHRGFDFNYISPAIFIRPVESTNTTSPDKMFLGLNAKYKILENVSLYSQFLLGEFTAKEFFAGNGYIHNKWGTQIGARGFDVFGVKNLNFLGEVNIVRPYTYQHFTSISNYSNHGEPLAHPRGANFKEILGIANYSWQRFDFSAQLLWSLYGTDPADQTNYGGDIFQSYANYPNLYGNKIGQGVRNELYYADLKAAYLLNPKYNLRLELGYTHRYNRTADVATQKSGVINIGLRSSFRNFYGDI